MEDFFKGSYYSNDKLIERHGGYWEHVHFSTDRDLINDAGDTLQFDNRTGNVTITRSNGEVRASHMELLDLDLTAMDIAVNGWHIQRSHLIVIK